MLNVLSIRALYWKTTSQCCRHWKGWVTSGCPSCPSQGLASHRALHLHLCKDQLNQYLPYPNVIPPDYSSTRCNACPAVLKTSSFSPLNSKNLLIAFGSLWGFFPVFQTADFLWVFLVGGFWVFLLFTNHPFVFIGLFLALFPMQEKVSCPVSVPWLDCPLTPHAQLFI